MEEWEKFDLISCLDKFADNAEEDVQNMCYAITDMAKNGLIDKNITNKAAKLRAEIISKIYELHSLGKK